MFATATSIDSRLTVGPAGSEVTPAEMCPHSPACCQPDPASRRTRHNFLRRLMPSRLGSLVGRRPAHTTTSRSCLLQTAVVAAVLVIACSVVVQARPHPSSHHSSGSGASSTKNLGVYITRSPESTTAPAGDEVLFECELNLIPERLEWRFRPQDSAGNRDDYVYLSREHGHNVTTVESNSKLHVYVNAKTIGEYRCVAWFGASAIASVPATLTLATLSPVAGNSISSNSNGYGGGNYGRGGGSSGLGDVHSGRTDRVPIMMRRVLSPIQQQHVKISPGNSIIIKCGDVVSNPPAIYSYYKDEIAIPANIPQLPTGGLILSQLTPQDSGTYRCSAVNSITGTELKLPLKTTIQVEYTPRSAPFTFSNPSNVSVTPGSSALLECPGGANPVPQATWYRRTRTHSALAAASSGRVRLPGGQRHRTRSDAHVKLTVLEPPRIVVPPRPTLTNESERLELECRARGSPTPEIYWMINGDYTKWDQLIKANGSKLVINSVQKKHAGIVQCFARNELGEVSESDLLQVKPKQIPGGMGPPPLLPPLPKPHEGTGSKRPKGTKNRKHKHRKYSSFNKGALFPSGFNSLSISPTIPPKSTGNFSLLGGPLPTPLQITLAGARQFREIDTSNAPSLGSNRSKSFCISLNFLSGKAPQMSAKIFPDISRNTGHRTQCSTVTTASAGSKCLSSQMVWMEVVMIPPSRPNITRLSDESVMVRWSVPSSDGLPIQFFKVQYRMLGDPTRNITRTQWMTENEDIPPYTRSYEVNGLKSDHFYRFRIVAVYSNNDNKEGAASGKFHLQRLGPKNHLLAPTLTRIEPVSQHAILLHWQFPHHLPHPIDGFYAYYRAATTAGEYSKATVDTPTVRHFKIDHLEPGTAYEFKLQSFTAAAASDFSAILTGKTLKPPTPPPVVPSVVAASEAENGTGEVPNYVYMGVGGFVLIVAGIILLCCCCVACKKKRGGGDETDAKSQHIQVEANGFPGGLSNGGPRSHHHKARNGISARMNITPNPLAQDGDKNRTAIAGPRKNKQTNVSNS
ncbi:cell adhesion molecule [Culex quinquefasciatus]|uniref:Interference hedgehog n=1 Tax=Culex quinquefasciatus TaxID=7176 RepID=B0W4B4_CULQU|nr:cell adhesion molecule [Culex quinquefasciatus]|eukprot:XP_001843556.1 cell adhesion molecule [Culex quinquefasciatus]